jgi:glycosyltransferase involved in cell wall biosynthesis
MKISVITCTWNSEAYLDDSIASVLAQDYTDVEYIFVDGGSTDGTLERIARIPYEVKILHNVRGGISHAMNEGIRIATGDVIAHMHSDDYYLGTRVFSTVVDAFQKSDCHWLFGRIMYVMKGKLIPEGYTRYSYNGFLSRNIVMHQATFIKRAVFEECGFFNESLKYAMDYDLLLRIAKIYPPLQLDEYLAAFRVHDGSTTYANLMQSLKEDFKVRCHHANWYKIPEATLRYLVRRCRLLNKLRRMNK